MYQHLGNLWYISFYWVACINGRYILHLCHSTIFLGNAHITAPNKSWYLVKFYFHMKIYVVGTLNKCLVEVLLISTHNIHFSAEIRKYSYFLVEKKKQKKKHLSTPSFKALNVVSTQQKTRCFQ